jgi:hypothetical protein
MSSPIPSSELEIRAHALLQLVSDDRQRRCAALRAASESQAKQIVRSALAEARGIVRSAVIHERARMDQGIRQATARAEIEAHRRERQKIQELLAQMRTLIVGVLERRWREPELRRAWINSAMTQAAALLAGRTWIIDGSSCTEQERSELTEEARRKGAGTVNWELRSAAQAGIKIRADRVCIDATTAGLLEERDAIEAAFLAYMGKHTDG